MKLEVVAAIIFYNGKVLVTQRKFSKNNDLSLKYEFPGGKVQKNEDKLSALKRELFEELDLELTNIKFFDKYSYNYIDKKISLNFYICIIKELNIKLRVHESYKLVNV